MTTDDDLRRLAEAATPGPWIAQHETGGAVVGIESHAYEDGPEPVWWEDSYTRISDPDAEYIAAASPDRILALLDRLVAAERQRDALDVERLRKLTRDAIAANRDILHALNFSSELDKYLIEAEGREPGEEG